MTKDNNENTENDIKEQVDPTKTPGNYIVQVCSDGHVIKQIFIQKATVKIAEVADQPLAFDIR